MSDLIIRDFNGHQIPQRADGYLNATAMCKANGKEWSNYRQNAATEEFVEALSGSLGIPRDLLVVTVTKGPNAQRGTFVHPHIGYNLGQWLSPAFAVQVSQWIDDIRSKGYATAPGVEIDHELAERTNGITRMLAKKVTGVEKLLSDMSARLDQFAALAAAAQPGTALVTTHASANEIAIERGAKQKGRHGLTVRIGNFLELACRDAGEHVLPGRDGKRMFPRSILIGRVLAYVDALVADHNRALDAQGDLLVPANRRRALAKATMADALTGTIRDGIAALVFDGELIFFDTMATDVEEGAEIVAVLNTWIGGPGRFVPCIAGERQPGYGPLVRTVSGRAVESAHPIMYRVAGPIVDRQPLPGAA